MSEWTLRTPVAFLVFNRPETTARVFAEIAKARPPKLLVVADGPRERKEGEKEKCAAVQSIVRNVNWPCEILTNYSASNMGCRDRVSSGLDWVFSNVPEAIILEDDCVPHASFFRFCEELLCEFREDERIGMICGNSFHGDRGDPSDEFSFGFSKYTPIWGWATWRRAWSHYDVTASAWPRFRATGGFEAVTVPWERQTWVENFDGVYEGRINTWDYQWTLACWSQSMLTVTPRRNLVSNIGFGPDATHTITDGPYANLAVEAMEFPLKKQLFVVADAVADRRTAEHAYVKGRFRKLLLRFRRVARMNQ